MQKKAVVLLSGGVDSTTCLALARSQNYACYALSFDYGQKQRAEINATKLLVHRYQVIEHKIIQLPVDAFRNSALTETNIAVPDFKAHTDEIPVTYVPARNTVFLSFALGWAEVIDAKDIFIGVNAIDYSNYPDCRPEYIQAFQKVANLATKAGVEGRGFRIQTPLIHLTKQQIIQLGMQLGVDYSLTVSCYQADQHGHACGRCDSCTFRANGFMAANVSDPTRYQTAVEALEEA